MGNNLVSSYLSKPVKHMDYTDLFRQTGSILRRSGVLWGIGFLAASLGLISNAVMRLGGRWGFSRLLVDPATLDARVNDLALWLVKPGTWVTGLVLLMLWFLLLWAVMTIGEGGMIVAAASQQKGTPLRFGQALSQGIRLLGPFIAIDTILFFPLFVLILLIMVIGAGSLFGGIILGARSGEAGALLLPLVVGGGLSLLLSFLILPVTLVTFAFRSLAFRAAALDSLGVRESIRHTWQLIRQKSGPVIAVTALIFGTNYALGLVAALVMMPASMLTGLPDFAAATRGMLAPDIFFSPTSVILTVITVLFTYIIQVAITIIVSTLWTVAYAALSHLKTEV